jgi:protein-L-isoaspartate(D-aspartate) O-methyltransferase
MRARLIRQLEERGITDEDVLRAMNEVPRHGFVASALTEEAYQDKALPIQSGQTISQPFTVAYMTQLLQLKPRMKVLEIGTGSGYQAAILAEMGMKVFSIEYDQRLHQSAKARLEDLGYSVTLTQGDGSEGWNRYAPYERIIVTAASPAAPDSLKQQLEQGGRLVIPVGSRGQQHMQVITRRDRYEFEVETLSPFHFVPLRGRYGFEEE